MSEYPEPRLTRREALKGGSAAAVAAGAYLMQERLVGAVSAQSTEPRIQLGSDWEIDDAGDQFYIRHIPTGASSELEYDSTTGNWTIGTLEIDELHTPPTGVLVQLNGDQTIANNTITTIAWETETTRGTSSSLINTTNNSVVIPSGYSWAKITIGYHFFDANTPVDIFRTKINGTIGRGLPRLQNDGSLNQGIQNLSGAWYPVTQGDEITSEVSHQAGSSKDLFDGNNTFMEVELR